jgi:hypothetical protein
MIITSLKNKKSATLPWRRCSDAFCELPQRQSADPDSLDKALIAQFPQRADCIFGNIPE